MSRDEPTEYPTPSPSKAERKSKKRPREEPIGQAPTKKHKKSAHEKEKTLRQSVDVPATQYPISRNRTKLPKPAHEQSPFFEEQISLYITLSPIAYDYAIEGAIAEHLSPLLLTYYQPLDGVVLAFENAQLSSRPDDLGSILGQSIDEYATTYLWLTADVLVFRPSQGTTLKGVVNLENEGMLGLLCYNYFNASIERSQIPDDWRWVEDGETEQGDKHTTGHFVAGDERIEGRVPMSVKDFEPAINDGGVANITIYGTMLQDKVKESQN